MNHTFRILLVALLLGPSLGQVLRPVYEVCAESERDYCEPGDSCEATCLQCPCCAARAITLHGVGSAEDPDCPPLPTIAVRALVPPTAPPSDILHVPKSV